MTKQTAISFSTLVLIILVSAGLSTGCGGRECAGTQLKGSVDLQGHRGARGKRPEDTIPAFIYCMEQGMTTIELDTNLTKDKVQIICHDTRLNGKLCVDASGNPAKDIPIEELTLDQIRQYDCGSLKNEDFPEQTPVKGTRLSTLREFFAFVREYERKHGIRTPFKMNIEIKLKENPTIEEILEAARLMVKTIEDEGMVNRVTVQSFVMAALSEVKKLNRRIVTSALFEPTYPQGLLMVLGFNANRDEIINKTIAAGADIISPYYLYVSSEFIRKCHEKNISVLPWTVNEKERMIRLMNCGVDGIISDYPDRLREAYDEWRKSR